MNPPRQHVIDLLTDLDIEHAGHDVARWRHRDGHPITADELLTIAYATAEEWAAARKYDAVRRYVARQFEQPPE